MLLQGYAATHTSQIYFITEKVIHFPVSLNRLQTDGKKTSLALFIGNKNFFQSVVFWSDDEI